jgi:hypothetical protein
MMNLLRRMGPVVVVVRHRFIDVNSNRRSCTSSGRSCTSSSRTGTTTGASRIALRTRTDTRTETTGRLRHNRSSTLGRLGGRSLLHGLLGARGPRRFLRRLITDTNRGGHHRGATSLATIRLAGHRSKRTRTRTNHTRGSHGISGGVKLELPTQLIG